MKSFPPSLPAPGRTAWVAEESGGAAGPMSLYRLDPELAWKRLKPRTTNKPGFWPCLPRLPRLARDARPRPAIFPAAGC